jgi:hypothetical protein
MVGVTVANARVNLNRPQQIAGSTTSIARAFPHQVRVSVRSANSDLRPSDSVTILVRVKGGGSPGGGSRVCAFTDSERVGMIDETDDLYCYRNRNVGNFGHMTFPRSSVSNKHFDGPCYRVGGGGEGGGAGFLSYPGRRQEYPRTSITGQPQTHKLGTPRFQNPASKVRTGPGTWKAKTNRAGTGYSPDVKAKPPPTPLTATAICCIRFLSLRNQTLPASGSFFLFLCFTQRAKWSQKTQGSRHSVSSLRHHRHVCVRL